MTLDGALALLFFLASAWCALLSMILHYEMVEAINNERRGEKPIDFLGFFPRPISSWRVFSLYRSCHENGPLLGRYWRVVGGQIVFFAMMVFFLFRSARP
jgi:hypothetical protein